LSLKAGLKQRPVIYEIVPPRRDTSRFSTELRGVEEVLNDSRIAAINVPELINRKEENGLTVYAPATIPPEEYAMMIKEYKESIVNIIAPRLVKEEFVRRAHKVLGEYGIPNMVLVGRERTGDVLPGPSVTDALRLIADEKGDGVALGGICIFNRESRSEESPTVGPNLAEPRRVWLKAEAGCDFVTSQITFDPEPASRFLRAYQGLCVETGRDPVTVFVSLATVPSPSILSLLESLDVVIPAGVRKRIVESGDLGKESVKVATEVFQQIIAEAEHDGVKVPLGLQIEQVGVNSGDLSLQLLDSTYPTFRSM
jgi:5,10-methylenetetrahydrofolate reductase